MFLDACRSAQANPAADPVHDRPTESVASALLQAGVGSVVAMSHSVLVETARRFVTAFYKMLAAGARVGDAMLAGQQALGKNKSRGRIFGGDELILHDWFVPVLFQGREDPRLFADISPRRMPVSTLREPHRQHSTPNDAVRPTGLTGILPDSLQERLGALPPEPKTGFVGRSRELLALERLLGGSTASNDTVLPGKISAGRRPPAGGYAVILGQGGEGKTALATEFARWQVRSQQTQRAAFLSVEGIERNLVESVLDRLGHQLLKSGFSTQVDCGGDIERATQKIEGALREQTTLLVLDNLESILPPPYLAGDTPDALAEENRAELNALLALCQRLLRTDGMGGTGILFTSREALPAPFDGKPNRRELHRLATGDAVELVARVLNVADHAESGKAIAGEKMAIAQGHEAIAGPPVAIAGPPLAIAGPSVAIAVPPLAIAVPPLAIAGPPLAIAGPPLAIAGPPVAIAGERAATVNTSVATAGDRLAAANQPMAIAKRQKAIVIHQWKFPEIKKQPPISRWQLPGDENRWTGDRRQLPEDKNR
uniref:CHAT domain-containing protein n=1 Tax=Candidatus Kentrum sp. DK TaxID=2126562 RepID=A0A450S0F3_9GAMM|nr:MAG: CHAT domain-containing protein [Candidatus Kentron sp. DK]